MRSDLIYESPMPNDVIEQRLAAADAPRYLGVTPRDRNIRRLLESRGWSGPHVLGVGGRVGRYWRRYVRVVEVSA